MTKIVLHGKKYRAELGYKMEIIDYSTYLGFKDPQKDRSILRDVRGKFLTQALFHETHNNVVYGDKYPALYSMKERHPECVSAYQIYMHSVDEYDAAMKLVGSLEHWRRLTGKNDDGTWWCRWFMEGGTWYDGLLVWREDMKIRDDSIAKQTLLDQAQRGNVNASKILMELEKKNTKVGRPSNKSDIPKRKVDVRSIADRLLLVKSD